MAQDETTPSKPSAPSWAVGLVFIITSGLSAATGTYFVVSSDIKEYLTSAKEVRMEEIKSGARNNAEENIRLREANIELSKRFDALLSNIHDLSTEKTECRIKKDICQRELEASNKRASDGGTKFKK